MSITTVSEPQNIEALREVVRNYRARREGPIPEEVHPLPGKARGGVFAWVPAGGIAARSGVTLTGVLCQLYQEVWTTQTTRTLEIITGYSEYVFNPAGGSVGELQFVYTDLSRHGNRIVIVESCT